MGVEGVEGQAERREEPVEKSPKAQTKDGNYSVPDPKSLKLTESLQLNCKRLHQALFVIQRISSD